MHLSIISRLEISLVQLVMKLVEGGCLATHTLSMQMHIRYGHNLYTMLSNISNESLTLGACMMGSGSHSVCVSLCVSEAILNYLLNLGAYIRGIILCVCVSENFL